MPQTVLSVVLEVEPASTGRLSRLIEELKAVEDIDLPGETERYLRLKQSVPSLHFMSMSVFEDTHYDPVFVIEANFDGAPGPFWAQLEQAHGPRLRDMLRCCKRPSDHAGPLYDAVTKDKSRRPVAPYLEARTLRPSVFHQGNRGLTRERILNEGALFLATRTGLAQADPAIPNPYRSMTAQEIHRELRAALLPRFSWLGEIPPTRITWSEWLVDWLRVFALALAVLFCLSLPGFLLLGLLWILAPAWAIWLTTPGWWQLAIFVGAGAFALALLRWMWPARAGEAAPRRSGGLSLSWKNKLTSLANPLTFSALFVLVVGACALVMSLVATPLVMLVTGQWSDFLIVWWPTFRSTVVSLLTALVFSVPAMLLWLRWLERRDSSHDAPPLDERMLRQMTRREDHIAQNHMGSIVLVKPGVLRMALFRTGHLALGLVLRAAATSGYLGSMRTVHFAHWAFINNGSRLMFFSNFDHSWDSYLDDFIEKAHGGLTLAWGSGVGFPPTRFLVVDGASHGRQFKTWARHSMAVSRFWFSAYKDYTVDQIERHARIASGLRKTALTQEEAAAWARDL
jgi:membrane protein implicated in regulation of membrane protease activity